MKHMLCQRQKSSVGDNRMSVSVSGHLMRNEVDTGER